MRLLLQPQAVQLEGCQIFFYEEMYGTYVSLLKAFIKNGSDSLENYKVAMDPRIKEMGFALLICIVVSILVTLVAKKFHWFGIA